MTRIAQAGAGVERLRVLARMQSERNPKIAPVARAIDGARHRNAVATLVWEWTSFRVWDDLVNDTGLSAENYTQLVVATVTGAISLPYERRGTACPAG